jgi:hypothetical protein
MLNQRWGIFFVLIVVLSVTVVSPIFAVNSLPGVTAGQYVKYGNFEGTDVLFIPSVDLPLNEWIVREVVAVSGQEVTIHDSIRVQYRNGTGVTNNNTILLNIETGTNNGVPPYEPGILLPSNLNEGDTIPPFGLGISINKTETRTYLGASRTVNIINYTISTAEGTFANYIVYDKASGIKLENIVDSGFLVAQLGDVFETNDPHAQLSFIIVETNIFGGSATNWTLLGGYIFVAVASIIVIVAAALALLLVRKRSNQNKQLNSQLGAGSS